MLKIHKIVTHENPDIDAMMSCMLLQMFGEQKIEGVSNAEIEFISANNLPKNKTARQLEKEGILLVDVGGGRFDTHPQGTKVDVSKLQRSATDLVAEYLGMLHHPHWEAIIEYTRLHDSTGHSLYSKDEVHHLTTIHTILFGFQLKYKLDDLGKFNDGIKILSCIPYYIENKGNLSSEEEHKILTTAIDTFLSSKQEELEKPYFEKIIEWCNRVKSNSNNVSPSHELDEIISLKAICIGAYFKFDKQESKVQEYFNLCIEAILLREFNWEHAIEVVKECKFRKVGKGLINIVSSENGLVIKASRYILKADITIYHNPENGAVSFILKRYGKFSSKFLNKIAALMRIAECINRQEKINYSELEKFGNVHGWFFHQSGNFLSKGSLKAKSFEKTEISQSDIFDLVCAEASLFLNAKEEILYPPQYESAINMFKLGKAFF